MPVLARSLVALLPLICLAAPAFAQWRQNGVPVYPDGIQQSTGAICADGLGGAYVAWREQRLDHLDTLEDVYLQHLTPLGFVDPTWPASGFPVAIAPEYQNSSIPLVDSEGAVYLAWVDTRHRSNDVYASRVLPNGTLAPGWPANGLPVCTAPGEQYIVFHCLDGSSGLFVFWADFRHEYNRSRIYWSHLTSTGELAPGWPVNGQPYLGSTEVRGVIGVLPADGGGVFALWYDERGQTPYGLRIYVTRTLADGTLASGWPSDGVVLTTSGTVTEITKILSDGAGGVFVGWNDNRNGSPNPIYDPDGYDIYAQHVLANGTIDPRWPADGLPVNNEPGGQYDFDMAPDAQGGAFFFWQDLRGNGQVFGQRLRADGSVAPGWVAQGRPLSTSFNHKFTPRAVADGQGGFYGTWEQYSLITGREEIYAQHVRSDGTLAPGWPGEGLAIATGSSVSYRNAYSVNPDGAGGAFLAFDAAGGGKTLVHAHRIANDGPVATRPSLVDATVNGDEVVVRWQASEAASLSAIVERQSEGSDWTALGAPELEGSDRLLHRERGLPPGRYGFRLRYVEGSSELHTEATWMEVTASAEFRLAGFRPNPARAGVSVAFSLPDGKPATIQLHDVSGRLVSKHEVGGRGAGTHLMRLDAEKPLPVGLYWVRLVGADRILQAKGVVVR